MPEDSLERSRSRALASPVRLKILQFCADEAHTNREIADELELHAGSSFHHVQTLVASGLLVAEPERTGKRGAKEVPYRSTQSSWMGPAVRNGKSAARSFVAELGTVTPDELDAWRLDLHLDAASKTELENRLTALLLEFRNRGADADGQPYSLLTVLRAGLASWVPDSD
jgi:predicted ArsR family transcriptional regulator